MSNNDGADFARSMAMGEELSRSMVEAEALRKENEWLKDMLSADTRHIERLRDVLRRYKCDCKENEAGEVHCYLGNPYADACGIHARAALEGGE
jgi:hypothetical protein